MEIFCVVMAIIIALLEVAMFYVAYKFLDKKFLCVISSTVLIGFGIALFTKSILMLGYTIGAYFFISFLVTLYGWRSLKGETKLMTVVLHIIMIISSLTCLYFELYTATVSLYFLNILISIFLFRKDIFR
ncbi:hypothetical protein V9L05_20085 [Bernardetia sp. Wsw4-3y2]|uniref:hypothetical protein n=1 Tax=Bernardetia sp. Wsw4-3y2 TaxID=3127471 RepID=UPI0030CF23C6